MGFTVYTPANGEERKFYPMEDGRIMLHYAYEYRTNVCEDMIKEDVIDEDIDCSSWILTNEGVEKVEEYIPKYVDKAMKFMQENKDKINEIWEESVKKTLKDPSLVPPKIID